MAVRFSKEIQSHQSGKDLSLPSGSGKKLNHESELFDNLPELIKPKLAASLIGVSIATLYDWKYRFKQRNIPEGLFVKIGRLLLIRTTILKQWIASQNPSLQCEG